LQLGDQLGAFVEEEVVETNIARGWKERARVSINFYKRLKLTPVDHFWTLRRDTSHFEKAVQPSATTRRTFAVQRLLTEHHPRKIQMWYPQE